MSFPPSIRPLRQVRVVLSSTALLSFVSTWKASALAIAELSVSAFLVAGILVPIVGKAAIGIAIGLFGVAMVARSIDLESWGIFLPGGLPGRVRAAFGPGAGAARRLPL